MFRYEKDMIPILERFFTQRFGKGYFVKEFKSGIGVADLVFSEKLYDRQYYFEDFKLMYTVLKVFNRKNKQIAEQQLEESFSFTSKNRLIEVFTAIGLIEKIFEGEFKVKTRLAPSVKEFHSVEAKLSDWKSGFYQALRYKNFAHRSYLAISEEFSHRVDRSLLAENNIGLLSVSTTGVKSLLIPRRSEPTDKMAYYYSGDNFVRSLQIRESKIPFCPHQWL